MLARVSLTLAFVIAAALHPVGAEAAGNVTVTQVGGTLRIKGDAEANQVGIVWDDAPAGSNAPGALAVGTIGGTTNGGTDAFVGVFVTDVIVDLGAGDDGLALVDVDFAHLLSLRIDTGSGDDWVNGEDSGAVLFKLNTGSGDDDVFFDGGGCGSCTIRSGPGDDRVRFGGFGIGKATVESGRGNDDVTLCTEVVEALDVRAGAGDDTLSTCGIVDGDARFDGGSGTDVLSKELSTTFNGGLKVSHFEQ